MAKINVTKVQTNNRKTLARDEEGLSTVEYVILLFLIAIIGIAAWKKFGNSVSSKVDGGAGSIGAL
jgi:Flp pilus assembly pilin Flp